MGVNVNELTANTTIKKDSTDTLLWLGGLIVAGVGISWLFLTQPWVSEPSTVTSVRSNVESSAQPLAQQASAPELESILDNPIRMARLAFEAGMLIEPENYSAWSLYERILAEEPDHAEALQGLKNVADVLVQRGNAAFEQGRLDDAQSIADHILGTLPEHTDAQRLAANLDSTALQEAAAAQAVPELNISEIAAEPAAVAVAEPIPIDPLLEILAAFETALAKNHLLTPSEGSAKYFVALLVSTNSNDERTIAARRLLFGEFIERADRAIELQDTQAAATWIDEAEMLDVNAVVTTDARDALTAHLIELESLKRVPASAMERIEYLAPDYPPRAAARGIEGWVDLEFIVAADGRTLDVEITESSHETHFRREALAGVEAWRFEPRSFMGQMIEQRSYTRVVFLLQ